MPTPTTTETPPVTEPTVALAEAAAMCDLTPRQLTHLLGRRANLIANSPAGKYTANPRPLVESGKEKFWAREVFLLWAVRMGLAPYGEDHLIGHAGIAIIFRWEEQSVRSHIGNNPSFPPRVQPPTEVVVFDRGEVMEYAIQHAILFPDGKPNVLRPHRGDPMPKKT